MTDYKVIMVRADSNHPLAAYVEKDEQLFVHKVGANLDGFEWFSADDFFACMGECTFTITGEVI